MHRYVVHLIVTLLAFGGGVIASPFGEQPECIAPSKTTGLAKEKRAHAEASEQSGERVQVNRHPNHPEILVLLKDLVARFGKAKWNIFYISPIARKGEGEYAYIYWKQDNSIITLDLPMKKPLEEESALWLYTGKARIDLVKGVVPTEDEVGSSTFLVIKPWVDRIIKDCVSNGQKVTIAKPVKRKARLKKS